MSRVGARPIDSHKTPDTADKTGALEAESFVTTSRDAYFVNDTPAEHWRQKADGGCSKESKLAHAFCASWIPARRAVATDPTTALRAE